MRWTMMWLAFPGACDDAPDFEVGFGGGVDADDLLTGLVDLSQDLEALELRVAALDGSGPPAVQPVAGCMSLATLKALLDGEALRPYRDQGHVDGLLVGLDTAPELVEDLGLNVGDRVRSVQGLPVATPGDRELLRADLVARRPALVTLEVRAPGSDDRDATVRLLTYRLGCLRGGTQSEDLPVRE